MRVLGIDPGMNGGLAILDGNSAIVEVMPTAANQLDLAALTRWLKQQEIDMVFLEEVHAIYKVAAAHTFKFGRVFGAVEGVIAALGLPYELVPPKVWQKEVHKPDKKISAKERSALAVSRLFPLMDLRASEDCRTIHDGMADALLIAEYGKRKLSK